MKPEINTETPTMSKTKTMSELPENSESPQKAVAQSPLVRGCSHDPRTLAGLPIGQYHCPECGEMVIAGLAHDPEPPTNRTMNTLTPKIIQLLMSPNDSVWQGVLLGLGDDGATYHCQGDTWQPYIPPLELQDKATEQRDSIEGMYHKVIAAVLECDPIPACQREDDQLEPPWEVITRIREQRDRLADLVRQFIYILDITEESDGGRLFHPTNITSCRAGDLQKIGELVEALRRASRNQPTEP